VTSEPPSSPLAGEPDDAGDREFLLLDRYWDDLRRGDTPPPHDWLKSHAGDSAQLLGQLEVLELVHRSREHRNEQSDHPESPGRSAPAANGTEASPPSLPDATWLEEGKLCILGLLDRGGMGEVYLAWDRSMNCQVAVKLTRDPALKARFRREIEIQPRLGGHPHIALARYAGEYDGRDYLVMDYVPGVNLQQFVAVNGPLPWREACDAIRQAAEGLEHAHSKNIVHRDIKPANLIRSALDRSIEILDWGLARRTDADTPRGDAGLTHSGCLLGTPDYMSPEQTFNPSAAGPASDLYSLGCTFHYLLTGKPPFDDLLDRHQGSPPLPPELGVPRPVEQVHQTLLRYKPADRYRSAHELVKSLEADLAAAPTIMRVPRKDPGGRPRRHWHWRWVAALLFVAGAGGLAWPLLSQSFGPKGLAQGVKKAEVLAPGFSAPPLERLFFYFDRNGFKEERHLVTAGRGTHDVSAEPLGPKDSFVIDGRFRQPTYWYVVWIDTAGVVDVMEVSPDERSDLRFPIDPRGRAYPNPQDPPGTHLILVAGGSTPIFAVA